METKLPLTIDEKLDLLAIGECLNEDHPKQSLYTGARILNTKITEENKTLPADQQKPLKKFTVRKGYAYRKK